VNPSETPNWHRETCVILASGPSLSTEQVARVRASGTRVIAVNNSWELAPWADVLYACDYLWFRENIDRAAKGFMGDIWTQDRAAAERWPYQLHWLRHSAQDGLGLRALNTNGNSGFGAINLGYLFGSRRLLLLGFDMKLGPNGEKHWHADHSKPLVQAQTFDEWMRKGAKLAHDLKAAKCEVINCTPGSAMSCFPMSTIEKELA
jgi:hypothetical protein